MTSERKIRSNRLNAQASTGPKTSKGKARASQNARRHGFSIPVMSDARLSADVRKLAKKVVGARLDPELNEQAFKFAEAQIELDRLRCAFRDLLNNDLYRPRYQPSRTIREEENRVSWLIYFDKLEDAGVTIPREFRGTLETLVSPASFKEKWADISKKLIALDRYARRAFSRRKFAIREIDRLLSLESL